ncbi:MAG: hypothetical protein RLZ14_133, partial [Actinomycetota bacterium]
MRRSVASVRRAGTGLPGCLLLGALVLSPMVACAGDTGGDSGGNSAGTSSGAPLVGAS